MDNYLEQYEKEVQSKPINWREISEKLLNHWKWFVISTILTLVLGFVYGRMQSDVYQTGSSILIIDQSKNGQMNEMSILKQLDAVGGGSKSYSMINNEEQVLKSSVLMKKVVKKLELYTSYTQKKFLKTTDLYNSSPLYVGIDSTNLNALKSGVLLQIHPDNEILQILGHYNNSSFQLTVEKLPAVVKTPAGVLYIQLRPDYEFPSEQIDVSISEPNGIAKSIAKGALSSEVGKYLDVIDLSVITTNEQKGKDILNVLADVYNEDASEQNNLSVTNTARFIDERLKLLAAELKEVEKSVENYKQVNKLTSITADADIYLEKTNLYDKQRIEVEMQQHLVKYVEDYVKNKANKTEIIPNLGLSDVGLISLIARYNELLLSRIHLAAGSTEQNPAIKTIDQQISASRNAILSSILNFKKGLQISNNDLTVQNSFMQSKIRDIPRQEREFIEIKRQQQVKESLYLFLLQKREEVSLNMAVSVPKARVLDTPDYSMHIGPNRSMIMMVFILIGLLIPAVLIYIIELFNTTIRTRQDFEKLSDIPVITELGHNSTVGIFIETKVNSSSNSELFRLLRTKLQFTLDHPTEKVILVTSTMSGEGKTFVSINLAAMLSLADKKVLLMGMDLRKPQLAGYFNMDDKLGISYFLSGQEPNYMSLIRTSEQYPNLDVLASGPVPPNPTELIMKDRYETMMNELKLKYDYIIIDTAPVGAVSDTFLIDRVADITLYVCRARYTDKRTIEFVNRVWEEKSLKRMFMVVNDVDLEASRYSYHGKYGYGYGYGYGFDTEK